MKKKGVMSTIFLQHFHNKSHVISYYQLKKICDKLIVVMALPKLGEKKKFCETLIMAMPLPKQREKKIVLAIVAIALPKKKKCYEICERVKKSCHVHNIFTTFSQ